MTKGTKKNQLVRLNTSLTTGQFPPILTPQEELELTIALYENHDVLAAEKLVLSHMRFVSFIVHGYKGYGLEQKDLIQEGAIGLMKAVKRFNPYREVRLASFAVYWIRAEIHEFILKNWKIVKVATTKAQRKLFFKLKGAKKEIYHSLTDKEAKKIALDLGVRPQDVLEMESRLQFNTVGFNINDNDDDYTPEDYLGDDTQNPELLTLDQDTKNHQQQELYQALNKLDERSLDILQSRYLKEEKQTLHTLAGKYGVSAERIRQLENKAMNQLKLGLSDLSNNHII